MAWTSNGLFGAAVLIASAAAGPMAANAQDARAACADAPIVTCEVACYIEQASAAEDPAVCLEAEDPTVWLHCVPQVIECVGEAADCDILPDDPRIPAGLPRAMCLVHLAVVWSRPELCTAAGPPLADACLVNLAEESRRPEFCEDIANAALRRGCEAASGD